MLRALRPWLTVTALLSLSLGGLGGCRGPGADRNEPISAQSASDLDTHRGRHRLLVVLSDDERDPKWTLQKSLLVDAHDALAERDVRVIQATGEAQMQIRGRLGLSPHGFVAALVGKDGSVKMMRGSPLSAEYVCAHIDRMPQGQLELSARYMP